MDNSYTHIAVLLDQSGSMETIKQDTEGGFKSFLEEQKAQPGKATLALSKFSSGYPTAYPRYNSPFQISHGKLPQTDDLNGYEVVHGPRNIQECEPFVLRPNGGTALLDAMGRFINDTGAFLRGLPEAQRPGNVLFAVITDGEENSSRHFSRQQIFDLVKEQTNKYGWTFSYLAAGQDAIAVGATYGFVPSTSMTYDSKSVGSAYAGMSMATSTLRSGGAYEVPDNA